MAVRQRVLKASRGTPDGKDNLEGLMADLIRVDAHAHLYRTLEEGYTEKTGYEVW